MTAPAHPKTWPDGYYLRPEIGWPRNLVLLCGDCAEVDAAHTPHEFIDPPDVEGHSDCSKCTRPLGEVIPL